MDNEFCEENNMVGNLISVEALSCFVSFVMVIMSMFFLDFN